jgi:hypothetical protein
MTKFATNSVSWFRGRLSIIFFDSVGVIIIVLSTFFMPLRLFRRFIESVTIFFNRRCSNLSHSYCWSKNTFSSSSVLNSLMVLPDRWICNCMIHATHDVRSLEFVPLG